MNGGARACIKSFLNKVEIDVKSIRLYSSQLENQLHFTLLPLEISTEERKRSPVSRCAFNITDHLSTSDRLSIIFFSIA